MSLNSFGINNYRNFILKVIMFNLKKLIILVKLFS